MSRRSGVRRYASARCTRSLLSLVLCLLVLVAPGCTFLPVKTPRPGSTVVYVLPPDSKSKLVLYLPDARLRSLVKVEREVVLQGEEPYVASLRQLLASTATENTSQLFPDGTRLVAEPVLNMGVLYLNFSREVQRVRPATEAGERLFLEALVQTLTEHSKVRSLQILIDGHKVDTLAGHFNVSKPLTRDMFAPPKK